MNTAVQKFQFFEFMGIAKLYAKMTCILMRISWKNSDLNFVFMQFVQKKTLSILNECAISCKTGFVLIRKWCGISCKKVISCKTTQLLRKRIDCFVETLHTLWSVRYGKLLKCCSFCKISGGGGDLYGHNMKLPVRKAMSTASSLLYLKVDNLVISQ